MDTDDETDTIARPNSPDASSSQNGAPGNGASSSDTETHTVSVKDGDTGHELTVEHGRSLWAVLHEHNLSPHGWLTQHLNCGGQGHCSACAVDVEVGADKPDQWLDRFLDDNGFGRLSCQIDVTEDMAIRI